jgi:DNA polymerase I
VRETAEYVASRKLHIGFADPYVYAKLVETEPRVATSAYKWVTGGAFSPHEYFEWSRLSYTPLSLMSNVTIGRILTTIEALHARRLRMLIDKSKSRRESWRSLRELVEFDRGGVVYQPKPGLYWCVCQVDFKSLYPSIIVEYNVSGETVNKPTCSNTLTPDWTLHGICLDEEGVVPASIRELIELKDLYDELYKKTGVRVYSERKSAVKWILVANFGYLGYRNSLFGSVSAHEVVTSTSREVMRRARLTVEREGFRVVHAIVDSVFIAGVKSTSECLVLKERVEEATGFRAKVEARYVWLYIPRSLSSSRGVANKY